MAAFEVLGASFVGANNERGVVLRRRGQLRKIDDGGDEVAQKVAALHRGDGEPVHHGTARVALGALLPALLLV